MAVLGLPIAPIRVPQLFEFMSQAIALERKQGDQHPPAVITYANTHSCNLFVDDPRYCRAVLDISLVYLDGNGPRIAAWLAGERLPPRMTAPDWIDEFCQFCETHSYRLFLLGSQDGVAATAADILRSRHPGLTILGHEQGYFDGGKENQIVERINALKPEILIVAMGSPQQECWMVDHRPDLRVPVIWGAGGALSYVSGHTRRPPYWMRRVGLEWAGRLILEPRRLWKRYLIGIPKFAASALRYAVRARLDQLLR